MANGTVIQVLDFVPRARRSMESFLLAFAARLRDMHWRTVFVFAGEPSSEFRARLAELNAPYLVADFPLTRTRARELGARLRPFAPTVVQTHYLSKFDRGLRALKCAAHAGRLVVTDRSSGTAAAHSLLGRLFVRPRAWWSGTYIDQVIAVSDFVRRRDTIADAFPAHKVRVVHNGVDAARFVPAAAPSNEVFTIAYAGQLIPEKGVLTLLRAVQTLVQGGANLAVMIAGRGAQADELARFCRDTGLAERVRFLGQVDDVEAHYRAADVVVVPSEWEEAFGFVAAEAAACGACLIVSDAGALPEVIGSDGTAGLIFRRGDTADLARQLAALQADPARRDRLRQAARARVETLFSIERMVDGYCAYFAELNARSRGP